MITRPCSRPTTLRYPNGVLYSGDQWSPFSGAGSNQFVQIGTAHSPCLQHTQAYGPPAWGTSTDKNGYESNYVLCIMTQAPTAAPTLLPTPQPTSRPTTATPTATPTVAPTRMPCNTQLHGCDFLTTYCANATAYPFYQCVCRPGYIPSSSPNRCDPAPSPTMAPTASTRAPTSAPSQHPCGTQLHG